jgi:2-amino-4-hydroxy-6-hydroxymethyldihydropteridine diphosphokinase
MGSSGHSHSAFVALGANLAGVHGDPLTTLTAAITELAGLSQDAVQVSPFYRSDPKDCPPGSPVYVNAVARMTPLPGEDPFSFLEKLQNIETKFGRTRSGVRNEARTLDLDLLSFDEEQVATEVLVLPHPRAHERRFVLEPWIILAGAEWPLNGSTLGEWLHKCSDPPLHQLTVETAS